MKTNQSGNNKTVENFVEIENASKSAEKKSDFKFVFLKRKPNAKSAGAIIHKSLCVLLTTSIKNNGLRKSAAYPKRLDRILSCLSTKRSEKKSKKILTMLKKRKANHALKNLPKPSIKGINDIAVHP